MEIGSGGRVFEISRGEGEREEREEEEENAFAWSVDARKRWGKRRELSRWIRPSWRRKKAGPVGPWDPGPSPPSLLAHLSEVL